MISEEMPMAHIAKATELQRGTVYRIKDEPECPVQMGAGSQRKGHIPMRLGSR